MDLIDSTCYSDGVNQPLLAVVGHQNGISRLLLFCTDSIGDISNVLVLNQTLPDNFQMTTPQDTFLTFIDSTTLFIRINRRVFKLNLSNSEWRFQTKDSSTNTRDSIRINLLSAGQGSSPSQNISYSAFYSPVSEFTTLDIANPNNVLFNLTNNFSANATANPNITRVCVDQAFFYTGHVWEIKLTKPPYISRNIELNTHIRKAEVLATRMVQENLTLPANTLQQSSLSHSRFSQLGNTTLIMQNIESRIVFLEAKPNRVQAVDNELKWNATIAQNCFEVALINVIENSFTAVLKCCQNQVNGAHAVFLMGVQATMALNAQKYSYNHFRIDYGGTVQDRGRLEVMSTGNAMEFVALMTNQFNQTASIYLMRYPTPIASTNMMPSGIVVSLNQALTDVSNCNLVRNKNNRGITTACSNPSKMTASFITLKSDLSFSSVIQSSNIGFYPLGQRCQQSELTTKSIVRCVYSTNTELYLVDYNEENSFALNATSPWYQNPRSYSLLQDYQPVTMTFTKNFIGVIGEQVTSSTNVGSNTPNYAFYVYHITSEGLYRYTNQTGQMYTYAAMTLPKVSTQATPFYQSTIYPYSESITVNDTDLITGQNITYSTFDNAFFFQDAEGNIYSHRIDPYILTLLNNHTKIKTFIQEAVFTNDAGNVVNPQVVSSLFENSRLSNKVTTTATAQASSGGQGTTTSLIIGGAALTVAVICLAGYYLLRRKRVLTEVLPSHIRYESGVMRL